MAHNEELYLQLCENNLEAQEALVAFERKLLELVDEYGEEEVYKAIKYFAQEEIGNFGDSVEGILSDWVHDYEQ